MTFPQAGRYALAVRYQSLPDRFCDFAVILRDQQEQGIFCGRVDANPGINTHTPYVTARNDTAGFVWRRFTVQLNRR